MNMGDFRFDCVDDFDIYISSSIPNYSFLLKQILATTMCLFQGGNIVDVGCTTGKLLYDVKKLIPRCNTIGIDIVQCEDSTNKCDEFKLGEAHTVLSKIEEADTIYCLFTLQFMLSCERKKTIKELKRLVDSGSKLFIAEKVYMDLSLLNTSIHRIHMMDKRDKFSDKSILDKDTSLFGVMHPLQYKDIIEELSEIGYVQPIWQSYNFMAWYIQKNV